MMIPKHRLLTLVFACLCFKKSFLITTLFTIIFNKMTKGASIDTLFKFRCDEICDKNTLSLSFVLI